MSSLRILAVTCVLFMFALNAQSDSCSSGVKLYSALDLAKEAFINIKEQFSECKNDTTSQPKGANCFCDQRIRSEAYINVAIDMIKMAKRKYVACGDSTSEDHPQDEDQPPQEVSSSKTISLPMDCQEVLNNGHNTSGVYTIHLKLPKDERREVDVYCDMDTDGGGWTMIQRRDNYDVQEKFFRNWQGYKEGFGNVSKDFWLGNDNIHYLTNQEDYSVRFDMEDVDGEKRYAVYEHFKVEGEDNKYKLFVIGYSGDAGDAMKNHNNMKFSTMYHKNDVNDDGKNCAVLAESGWWFEDCSATNPNGVYKPGFSDNQHRYIFWYRWKKYECLKAIQMKLRRFV